MKNIKKNGLLCFFALMAGVLVSSVSSCSNEDKVAEVPSFSIKELEVNTEFLRSGLSEHGSITRSPYAATDSVYDIEHSRFFNVNDKIDFYLTEFRGDPTKRLMSIPTSEEVPYLIVVKQIDEHSFDFYNEFDEFICRCSYDYASNTYKIDSTGGNDIPSIATRSSTGLLCSVGIEVICSYSCLYAGITGGWSIFVGCCGAAAAYYVC